MGCSQIVLSSFDASNVVCRLEIWFSHLCFGFGFSALLVKTWMVSKVFNSGLKKVKVSVIVGLKNVALIMTGLVAFLLIITFVGNPHSTTLVTSDVHKPLKYIYCTQSNPSISPVLLVLEAIALAIGLKLCWDIRNVPDALNESKYIRAGI